MLLLEPARDSCTEEEELLLTAACLRFGGIFGHEEEKLFRYLGSNDDCTLELVSGRRTRAHRTSAVVRRLYRLSGLNPIRFTGPSIGNGAFFAPSL